MALIYEINQMGRNIILKRDKSVHIKLSRKSLPFGNIGHLPIHFLNEPNIKYIPAYHKINVCHHCNYIIKIA